MVSSPDGTVRQIRFRIGLYIMLCVAALDQTHYLTRSITVKKHCAARQSLNDRLNSIEKNPEHFCSPLLRLQLHKINLSERQSIQFYLAWHLFHKPIARETSGGSKLKCEVDSNRFYQCRARSPAVRAWLTGDSGCLVAAAGAGGTATGWWDNAVCIDEETEEIFFSFSNDPWSASVPQAAVPPVFRALQINLLMDDT